MSASNPQHDQQRHERLCAYLFGELEGAERARFEAELEASPELQEERARLEATIALVRDALPAAEALSPDARAELSAAAAGGGGRGLAPVHPWPARLARSPYAAAAAVLVALVGVAALALRERRPEAEPTGRTVARAEPAPAEAVEEVSTGLPQDAKRDDVAPAGAPAAGDAEVSDISYLKKKDNEAAQELGSLDRDAGGYRGPGDGVPPEAKVVDAELLEQLKGLGYAEADESDARGGFGAPAPKEKAGTAIGVGSAGKPRFDMPYELNQERQAEEQEHFTWRDTATQKEAAPEGQAVDDLTGLGGVPPLPESMPAAGGSGGGSQSHGATAVTGTGTRSAFISRRAGGGKNQHASTPAPQATPTSGSDAWLLGGSERRVADGGEGTLNDLLTAGERDGLLSFDDGEGTGRPSIPLTGTPFDRDSYCDELVRSCRIRPRETPSMMFFRCWGDNPFELAQLDPLSTFAADVDTASYALARNYLAQGYMPTKAQIRTEEFVNSFDSGVPAPVEDVFALDLELAPSLFGARGEWMLRVVLRGKQVDKTERPHLALTFVVDVSGSMQQENRLELVKHALRLLVGELDARDSLAIVAFSSEARLVLPLTSAGQRGVIESAVHGLTPDGSTNAEAGLRMGYEVAGAGLTAGANNRVVLLSDGVANVGSTGVDPMLASVAHQRARGIYLNTIGVGMGNHNDALLEQLADKGDGICNYIDSEKEAVRALVENFTGAFVPLARDVKLQVQFDPAQVQSYRLLGYENRAVADAQFRDDKVDAGEIGAGHQVTALYELVRSDTATNDGPLATARARFKPPFAVDVAKLDAESSAAAEVAREIERGIAFSQAAPAPQAASAGYQKAVIVAQFAELLRRSIHARGDGYDRFLSEALRLQRVAEDPAFTDFVKLAAERRDLIVRHLPADDAVCKALDELSQMNYLQGQLERLKHENRELTDELLEKLQRENADLEQRIKDLIKEQLEKSGR